MTAPATISADEVRAHLDYPSLIDRLEDAFRTGCEAPLRHRLELPEGAAMLIKPVWRDGGPVVVKVVNIFPGNAGRGIPALHGTVMMFDGETGVPVAAIDGQALTNRRTAAASALASRYLSSAGASVHLVVGTGQLSPELARAHAAVRPIRRTLVWGRTPGKAEQVAAALRDEGFAAEAAADLAPAVAESDIVTCATLATAPLVSGAWLHPGIHLDLVGSFQPHMREADDAAIAACRLFVDTRDGALSESGDLVQPIRDGVIAEGDIAGDLAELCRGSVAGRATADEMTLFKSVGTAVEDLAAAELVWERASK